MKNIFKLILASVIIGLSFISCNNDDYNDWKTQEPSFKLYETTLGANVLYASMKDNPFVLTWDQPANASGDYSVVVSATEDFASKVQLGTSKTTSYKTTIGALNLAMLQAGINPYAPQLVFVRIENGSQVSNTISFTVTPYPVAKPILTSPTTSTSFVLDAANPTTVVSTVAWNDYATYGVDVVYNVEVAPAGTDLYQNAGTVTNLKQLEWTNKSLNDVILKTGAAASVEASFDVRVTATTESAGGSLVIKSDIVTIKVTPFASNVTLFLIGDATAADWTNDANNINMYPLLGDHNASTKYSYTGYFKAGGFKLIKDKGSWDAQYGQQGDVIGSLDSSGGSKDIKVLTAGYYKLTVNVSTLTYTLDPVATPTTTYPTVGIIGSATPKAWDSSTAMTQSAFDAHVWYMANVTLTDGELKFRANDSWDINWGSADENFGTATQGGANVPVKAGVYNVYFNDATGAYTLVKQ